MPETVVVGVGRSAAARAAPTWAADWAFLDPAQPRAVYAITPAGGSARSWCDDVADRANTAVVEFRDWGEVTRDFDAISPHERWTLESVRGLTDPVLAEAAAGASQLVVGPRHRTGLSRLIDGSVDEDCLRPAGCAVTAVPATAGAGGLDQTSAGTTER